MNFYQSTSDIAANACSAAERARWEDAETELELLQQPQEVLRKTLAAQETQKQRDLLDMAMSHRPLSASVAEQVMRQAGIVTPHPSATAVQRSFEA